MVSLTLILRECGSVHMKLASMILTFDNRLSLRRHKARSSRDSGAAVTQWSGGCNHLSQSLHINRMASLGMPSDMSIVILMQSLQRAPAAVVPSIGTPQLQHTILEQISHDRLRVVRKRETCVAAVWGVSDRVGNAMGASMSIASVASDVEIT